MKDQDFAFCGYFGTTVLAMAEKSRQHEWIVFLLHASKKE